jgi:hypothetical protein
MSKGNALPAMIWRAMRTEPVSIPISGASARCSGCVLTALS